MNADIRGVNLYKDVTKEDATHLLYTAFNGRRVLVPLQAKLCWKEKTFFGLSPVLRLLTFIRFVFRPAQYALLSIPEAAPMASWVEKCLVCIGTEGPYQKFSVLKIGSGSEKGIVAKLALSKKAGQLLEHEAKVLAELAHLNVLADNVPQLIEQGGSGEAMWLVQMAGFGRACGRFQGKKKAIEFLRVLAAHTGIETTYRESNCRRQLHARAEKIYTKLSPAWRNRCHDAQIYLDRDSEKQQLMVMAHRDFTRWNIKIVNGCVFVFDWEYAEWGYPELYDLFHFMLMPYAARGEIKPSVIYEARKTVSRFLSSTINNNHMNWQLVFYFFDICLLYLESNDGEDCGDKVVELYAKLIDSIIERNVA